MLMTETQSPSEHRVDHPQKIAHDATTILINLTADREILEYLASDKEFVKILLGRVTVCQSPLLHIRGYSLIDLHSRRIRQNQTRT